VSSTQITGTTPAASSPGAKDVVVTSSSQGSGTCSGCFGYVATDGQIAFTTYRDGSWEIFVMNADGSGQVNLTNNPGYDAFPVWSPDGSKIAFTRDSSTDYCNTHAHIYVMNADGSGVTQLTNGAANDIYPVWSPDSTKLAFDRQRDSDHKWELYVINADGSGQMNLSNSPADNFVHFTWSPDGTRIAFECHGEIYEEICLLNADGSGRLNLTNHPDPDLTPVWRPK
ncbi:MAG TPA: hypothetical protein VGQ18_00630, partial [Gemmatimonadales bacterium]|nr:hypothetical protein [Gemmatimonadales bacterium]